MNWNRFLMCVIVALTCCTIKAQKINIVTEKGADVRQEYAAEYLEKHLSGKGFQTFITANGKKRKADHHVFLKLKPDGKKESFSISTNKNDVTISGSDGSGLIYGAVELCDGMKAGDFKVASCAETSPEMVLRGACVGLQKTEYLPGRGVYEYPYTPENFPWFYDKQLWIKYLDMLVDARMNSLYLWNGHPFASLVRLKDYPFAVEVDSATFKKNEEMFAFLTDEANRRGIFVIQMFYNIILSKPFADHYGLKTQDRNRPISPLLSDYTRKSIAAFVEKYSNVGLLVCLGEAMDTYEDDVEWFTKTIIPGVKDGLKALGRTDEPPILLRAHDTNCQMVMEAALPLYKNLYTMNKYTGESLTTYQPQGPWAETHRSLAALGSTHIENVHILANLEPWRWSSPDFVQKTVNAMHNIHHANALHLYPQASYWDWPNSADAPGKDGKRLLQIDRDRMWYDAWGRYAWNCHRDRTAEIDFWTDYISQKFDISKDAARQVLTAYEESGEIAPKLIRRFGITEGNRQTLLLGMMASQLVNPYKYRVWPGFYESCGPTGEKLIEYAEKEFKHEQHVGELPLDIVEQTCQHGDRAVAAIDKAVAESKNVSDELRRLQNDMHCYREFAYAFGYKVKGANHVLNYKWTKDISELNAAVPLMEKGLEHYRKLVSLTRDTYLYANSMQTAQRRIPVGGDGGKMKTWAELLPKYEEELTNLKKNIVMLREKGNDNVKTSIAAKPIKPANVTFNANQAASVEAQVFSDLENKISEIAPELKNFKPLVFSSKEQRENGTTLTFNTEKPVTLLVGYFRDDQKKYAPAPRLETDASANDYGQAEPLITSAVKISEMPLINIHGYHFEAGNHELRLPKGMLIVLGATSENITPHNAAIAGADDAIDWLFY